MHTVIIPILRTYVFWNVYICAYVTTTTLTIHAWLHSATWTICPSVHGTWCTGIAMNTNIRTYIGLVQWPGAHPTDVMTSPTHPTSDNPTHHDLCSYHLPDNRVGRGVVHIGPMYTHKAVHTYRGTILVKVKCVCAYHSATAHQETNK